MKRTLRVLPEAEAELQSAALTQEVASWKNPNRHFRREQTC